MCPAVVSWVSSRVSLMPPEERSLAICQSFWCAKLRDAGQHRCAGHYVCCKDRLNCDVHQQSTPAVPAT